MSTPLRHLPKDEQIASDTQPAEAETRMRLALGLPTGSPDTMGRRSEARSFEQRQRRGERNIGPSINRVAVAELALSEERHLREQAEKRLRSAETSLREAQTKLGHAELARDEALVALAAERRAREAAEDQVRQMTPPPASEVIAPVKREGRPRGSVPKLTKADESEPVEWWVPGWKERL